MAEVREPLGADAALAHAHFHRVARHQPDRHERDEHQRDEGRNGQRDPLEEELEQVPPATLLEVDPVELVRRERALLEARHVGAHRLQTTECAILRSGAASCSIACISM